MAAGEPVIVKKAVCMHEEDTSTAWKHVEYRNGRNDMRRGRRLAMQFVATIANYDYIFCIVSLSPALAPLPLPQHPLCKDQHLTP